MPNRSDGEILAIFREVISSEAKALELLVASVDERAARAVRLILDCKGKVVTTGVGKSGFVARKVASTLSSTGTLAVFLHPTEASHGDLGLVQKDDVVIAFSKSGESVEINQLLGPLHAIGARVIGVTADPQSTMGRAADVAIFAGVDKEACPLDLAPTSSVVAALAVGDAIAIALMKLKGFRERDFAQFHPGGRLGKKLQQRVRDVMIPLARCHPLTPATANFDAVMGALGQNLLGMVLFTGANGRLEAVLTDGDLRRALRTHRERIFSVDLREMWNASPVTCQADDLAANALDIMERREKPLNLLPVLEGDRAAGVVRLLDIFA